MCVSFSALTVPPDCTWLLPLLQMSLQIPNVRVNRPSPPIAPLPHALWEWLSTYRSPLVSGEPLLPATCALPQSDNSQSSSTHLMLPWEKAASLVFCKPFKDIFLFESEVKHVLKHKIGPFLAVRFLLLWAIHRAPGFAKIDSLHSLWQLWCVN